MKRSNNRGVSLIEILIAVVIFALCVTPIIAQLASSIRIGQRADDQQAATDYGRSVAETMKQTDLDSLFTTMEGKNQFADTLQMNASTMTVSRQYSTIRADGTSGSTVVDGINPASGVEFASVTERYQYLNEQNKNRTAELQEALVRKVTISGTADIDYREYDVEIEMNTEPYARASLAPATTYVDPNAVNLGNLSSLDAATTAVIQGVSNYDAIAAAADFNNVVSVLENSGDADARDVAAQIKNGTRLVNSETRQNATQKEILVTITEMAAADFNSNKYKVTCEVMYTAPAYSFTMGNTTYTYPDAALNATYTAYEQYFKEIPEVYLLYNQFLYYNLYGNDLIKIDNQANRKAKVYVVRTAATNAAVTNPSSGGTGGTGGAGGSEDSGDTGGTGGAEGTGGSGASTSTSLLPTTGAGRDNKKDNINYDYMTNFELLQDRNSHPVAIYTNIPLVQGEHTETTNISSSIDAPNDRSCKMSINVPADKIRDYVFSMQEDERYSEQGRAYNIVITLTNKRTGNVTTFDTSKGDY